MRNASPLTQGVYLKEFENKFADYLGIKYAFAVSSATAALEIAAQLCSIQPGEAVMGVRQIERCISDKTRAIVVPHLYGYGADMPEIMKLAKSRNILVIEDVAQAIGVTIDNKMAGSYGDIAVFSFHAHKNISSLGEGGVIVVKDDRYAEILPMLRHNGHCDFSFPREDYWLPAMGNVDMPELYGRMMWPNNFCLGEVGCALAAKLLDRVEIINNEKRKRALTFIDSLSDYPELKFHRVNSPRHNYHLLVAMIGNGTRDLFIRSMAQEYGIQCVVQYYPLYRYPLYKKLDLGSNECPNTDKFFDNMISFPFGHSLTDSQLDFILSSAINVLESIRS